MNEVIIKIITLLNALRAIFALQKLFNRVKKIILTSLVNFLDIFVCLIYVLQKFLHNVHYHPRHVNNKGN